MSPELELVLADIAYFLNNSQYDSVIIAGDINCDFSRRSAFVNSVNEFFYCKQLQSVWMSSPVDFTHEHTDDSSTSVIDHFMLPSSLLNRVVRSGVLHHVDNVSRHSAITLELKVTTSFKVVDDEKAIFVPRTAWYKANEKHIQNYHKVMCNELGKIDTPNSFQACSNISCQSSDHISLIDYYCHSIINSIIKADGELPKTEPPNLKHSIPGWSVYIKPYRDESNYWHLQWELEGKPKSGYTSYQMRLSRRQYHYAIRNIRKNKDLIKRCNLLHALISGPHDFNKEINKLRGTRNKTPSEVNGISGDRNIAEMFAHEYKSLYNSCTYSEGSLDHLMCDIQSKINSYNKSLNDATVTSVDIELALKCIKSNKADGVYPL